MKRVQLEERIDRQKCELFEICGNLEYDDGFEKTSGIGLKG